MHVVANWTGNSAAIAAEHYLLVSVSDFEAALQNPVQSGAHSIVGR